ncbi:hypothetical protein [Pseudarthrobacter sp. N5]|uniref:hypothetical protein n=1 Tax=Pseudarthrobacter sp. N5 TaxID=3418416 RepID=UPI003CF834EE
MTLVECKLASNPQIRREVVGQMFDYASRLWGMDPEDFNARWRARTSQSLFDHDEEGLSLRATVADNLAEGRFRIVLAVDAINAPLKRMIEYLNTMSGPATSVIAVEYARLRQGQVEILMPQVYGQEMAETKSAATRRGDLTQWGADSYRAWIAEHDGDSLPAFDLFLAEALAAGMPFVGSKAAAPAGNLKIVDSRGVQLGTVSFLYFRAQGTSVELNFTRIPRLQGDELPEPATLDFFLQKLEDIPELTVLAANMRISRFESRRPNVPLSSLSTDSIRSAVAALALLRR